MNRNKLLIIGVCLFLVQSFVFASPVFRTIPLQNQPNVSPLEAEKNSYFFKSFNVLTFALGIYKLDVKQHLSNEIIEEKLAKSLVTCKEKFGITFDLYKVKCDKKSSVRYYVFTVDEKDFIIRFFDLKEKNSMPKLEVLYEGVFGNSKIGFQVLPGLNTMLEDKKIEKIILPFPTLAFSCP